MPNRDVKIRLVGQDSASDDIKRVETALGGLGRKAAGLAAGFVGLNAAASLGSWAIKLTADAELLETQMGVMLRSTASAKFMIEDLAKFAAETPFELPELADASKKLIAFGIAQEQVIPTMRRLGDIASGLGIPLGDLAEIYGKARVQGRLFAEDINQLTGRGIPVIQEFAKQFGVAESGVRKLVETGKIGFGNLEQAIVSLTAQGSMFGGGMEKASMTLAGQFSTLNDEIKGVATTIGTDFLPFMKEIVAEAAMLAKLLGVKVGRGSPEEKRTAEQNAAADRIRQIDNIPWIIRKIDDALAASLGIETSGEERKRLAARIKAMDEQDRQAAKSKVDADRLARGKENGAAQSKFVGETIGKALADASNASGPVATKMRDAVSGYVENFIKNMPTFAKKVPFREGDPVFDAWAAKEKERANPRRKERDVIEPAGALAATESRFLTRGGGAINPLVREQQTTNRLLKEEQRELKEQNKHLKRIADKRGLQAANL